MPSNFRVRFAPSPTGPLHIGGVRTALYNYLFAKKNNGTFILRIEDTDLERTAPGAEEYIIESLKWCGINFDEGYSIGGPHAPYKQSEKKECYKKYAEQLVEKGNAYYCFDTEDELQAMKDKLIAAKVPSPQYNSITRGTMRNSLTLAASEVKNLLDTGCPYVIRIKIPRKEDIRFNDLIRDWVIVHSSQIDDKVLLKSDGMPTYHLANIIDDHEMKITHVIRGEEWLPSAPLHVLLYRFFGWEDSMPQFAHLPLLLRPDGNGKLSKRDGDQLGMPVFPLQWKNPETGETYMGYREEGYFPEAFINYLAFLGWNPGGTQEIFSLDQLVELFSLDKVHKAGARFDPVKIKWFNQQYVRKYSTESLAGYLIPILEKEKIPFLQGKIVKICEAMKERITFLQDLRTECNYFYFRPESYDHNSIQKNWTNETPSLLSELCGELEKLDNFVFEEIEKIFKFFVTAKKINTGKLLNPFRIAVIGVNHGPSMFIISEILGKKEVIDRIKIAIEKVKK